MPQHPLHLISGAQGSGKTTYARGLAQRIGGVRLSLDEWMAALFWMDTPRPLDGEWMKDRMIRCLDHMWSIVEQVTAQNVPCVWDMWCAQVDTRQRLYRLAADAEVSVQLHFLDVPAEERWQRIESRNRDRGTNDNHPFHITREVFEQDDQLWEIPSEVEVRAHNGIRIT